MDTLDEWVERIVAQRSSLLAAQQDRSREPRAAASRGRLLLLLTRINLQDGAASIVTNGLIGELNLPPCDLWVGLVDTRRDLEGRTVEPGQPALVAWIPPELIQLAQLAIDVNAEGSLVWADAFAPELSASIL